MKNIVFILLSFCLAQEMEVDGDLKVTGTIQNDSLAQVIAVQNQEIATLQALISQLQAQITLLESQMALVGGDLGYADCFGIVGGSAVIDVCGVCDGNNESMDACGECEGDAENEDECFVTDIDGNTYEIVTIGDQVWMAENLTTSRYNDNSPIPYVSGASDWGLLTTGAYSNYGNDPNIANINGKLYNWFAVEDYRGICPVGWDVPNDTDFMQLEIVLGMHDEDALNTNWRGGEDDIGSMLASNSNLWDNGLLEMSESFDESGIKVIPAGVRWDTGVFNGQLNSAYFWTSSLYNSNPYAWYRHLSYNNTAVMRTDTFAKAGMSIRCIKD